VSDLPAALQPWAVELAIFPPEIQQSLGPWLLRLDASFGCLRAASREREGDPDGFDGLARKGPYSRMLVSDWLLADQLPDEFMRRAAAAEHSFLRLALATPKGARATGVVFDAGPFQLGAPRIAHLAILIVLARRARAAQAVFRWGVLQAPAVPPFELVTPVAIQHLLSARTIVQPTEEMLAGWCERLGADGSKRGSELWVVGGERICRAAAARGAASVVVQDLLEPGKPSLRIAVSAAAARPARALVLELPEPRTAARLLRDPFAVAVAPRKSMPVDATASSRLVFSASGSKAFARMSGGLLQFPVPNSARDGLGRVKRIQLQGLCTAVGRYRRLTLAITADMSTRSLRLYWRALANVSLGHFTSTEDVHRPWEPQPSDDLRPVYVYDRRGELVVLYVDGRRNLFELTTTGAPRILAREVLASCTFRNGAAFIARKVVGAWITAPPEGPALLVIRPDHEPRVEALDNPEIVAARIGTYFSKNGEHVMFAALNGSGDWVVHCGGAAFTLRVANQRAVAIHHSTQGASLLVLDADQKTFFDLRQTAGAVAFVAPARVTHVIFRAAASVLAITTAERSLLFYSLLHSEVMGRFELGGSEPGGLKMQGAE